MLQASSAPHTGQGRSWLTRLQSESIAADSTALVMDEPRRKCADCGAAFVPPPRWEKCRQIRHSGERREHALAKVRVPSGAPQWGSVDAPVTIVELTDFQCPFCQRVQPTLEALKQKYGPAQLRLVWKHNPLPFHEYARPAHELAAAL